MNRNEFIAQAVLAIAAHTHVSLDSEGRSAVDIVADANKLANAMEDRNSAPWTEPEFELVEMQIAQPKPNPVPQPS